MRAYASASLCVVFSLVIYFFRNHIAKYLWCQMNKLSTSRGKKGDEGRDTQSMQREGSVQGAKIGKGTGVKSKATDCVVLGENWVGV